MEIIGVLLLTIIGVSGLWYSGYQIGKYRMEEKIENIHFQYNFEFQDHETSKHYKIKVDSKAQPEITVSDIEGTTNFCQNIQEEEGIFKFRIPSFAEEGDLLIGKVTHLDKPKLPDEIGVCWFNDGTQEVYTHSVGVPPSIKYTRSDIHDQALELLKECEEALDEIAECRGRFNMDNNQFAKNVIENSKELAEKTLEKIRQALQPQEPSKVEIESTTIDGVKTGLVYSEEQLKQQEPSGEDGCND